MSSAGSCGLAAPARARVSGVGRRNPLGINGIQNKACKTSLSSLALVWQARTSNPCHGLQGSETTHFLEGTPLLGLDTATCSLRSWAVALAEPLALGCWLPICISQNSEMIHGSEVDVFTAVRDTGEVVVQIISVNQGHLGDVCFEGL